MSEMVEVIIDSVRVSLMSSQRLVVLRQAQGERYLPIWVGPYEAESITVGLQEIEMIRPLTHDLLKNIFTSFGARIKRVEIVALRDEIFYGNIVAEADGQTFNIDARPSDALAVAVRARVPILVESSVMDAAAIIPEQDMRSQRNAPAASPLAASPEPPTPPLASPPPGARSASEETSRLSIFEDFLSKFNEDKPSDEKDDPPQEK